MPGRMEFKNMLLLASKLPTPRPPEVHETDLGLELESVVVIIITIIKM